MTKIISGALVWGLLLLAGCSLFSKPDPQIVLVDGWHMGSCQQEGRLVKAHDGGSAAAWETYDKCMRDYGYRDGGVK